MDLLQIAIPVENTLKTETQLNVISAWQKYILNTTTCIMFTLNTFSFLINFDTATTAIKTCFNLQQ